MDVDGFLRENYSPQEILSATSPSASKVTNIFAMVEKLEAMKKTGEHHI